eukprot:SAG22_NODE_128_length_18787_cov_19.577108_3_plen_76_part_00
MSMLLYTSAAVAHHIDHVVINRVRVVWVQHLLHSSGALVPGNAGAPSPAAPHPHYPSEDAEQAGTKYDQDLHPKH